MLSTIDVEAWCKDLLYGSTCELPAGIYQLDKASIRPGITIDARKATFIPKSADVKDRTVTLNGGDRWIGGRFDAGAFRLGDALAAKIAALPEGKEINDAVECPPVLYTASPDVSIERALFNGFERPIMAVNAHYLSIEKVGLTGFYAGKYDPTTKIDAKTKDFTRTSYGIYINGGRSGSIRDVKCLKSGGAVVLGSAGPGGMPQNWLIERVIGIDLGDNGVYLSSAERCEVQNCMLQNVAGVAVKLRGSDHLADRVTAIDCWQGVGIEGVGEVADAYGANGAASRVERCTFMDIGHIGVWSDLHRGLMPRDGSIERNHFLRCPASIVESPSTTSCAISLRGGRGFRIDNNIVEDCKGEVWLHLGQNVPTGESIDAWSIGRGNRILGGSNKVKIFNHVIDFFDDTGLYG